MAEHIITIPFNAKAFYAKDAEAYTISGTVICDTTLCESFQNKKAELLITSGLIAGIRMFGTEFIKNTEYLKQFEDFLISHYPGLKLEDIQISAIKRSDGTYVLLPLTIAWEIKDCMSNDGNCYNGNGFMQGQFAYGKEKTTAFINKTMQEFVGKFGSQLFETDLYLTELKNYIGVKADDSTIESISLENLTIGGNQVNYHSDDLVS